MSRNSLALALVLLVGSASSLACSFGELYLTDPLLREVSLTEQQKRYTELIRWSAFSKAVRFVQHDQREEFMKVAPPLKDFRFSDYDSEPVELDDAGECTVHVVYYGYRTDSPFEVEVHETQHWKRANITNEWLVTSKFEGLDEAIGRSASN
jgi:hypothetical protein